MSRAKFRVAIVGGGFSGTILAVQLVRQPDPACSIILIEKNPVPGRGLAYGTECDYHRLNVPADNMSVFPDDPDHFLRWAKSNYHSAVQPRSFLPRRVYGEYINSLFREAQGLAGESTLVCKQDQALSIRLEGGVAVIQLCSGSEVLAEKVVLATGNFPPTNPVTPGRTEPSRRYIPFAWSSSALQGLPQDGSVLLLGSGLTSLDLILALKAKAFRGNIHILSRHGLIPQRQQVVTPWPQFWNEHSPRTARGLTRLVRDQVLMASEMGIDWRAVIDALRPVTPKIWQSLPVPERKRFLRHARCYWEVHRHRVAPEIADVISDLMEGGQIQIHSGHILRFRERPNYVDIAYRDRKSGRQETLRVDRVINCTGSESDCRKLDDPLILNILSQGLGRPDPLFLGVDVDPTGTLLDANGVPSEILFALGPVRKGALWETTAVPEIRTQALQLARRFTTPGRPSSWPRLALLRQKERRAGVLSVYRGLRKGS
jgi:uncharacterized NAD(P)/FAD-binding protein YdhS